MLLNLEEKSTSQAIQVAFYQLILQFFHQAQFEKPWGRVFNARHDVDIIMEYIFCLHLKKYQYDTFNTKSSKK